MFTLSGGSWTQQAELTASDGGSADAFGWSAALSSDGNTALMGATGKYVNQGAAYVFTLSGGSWTQQAELTASDGAAGDFFGDSVALSSAGNTALVGRIATFPFLLKEQRTCSRSRAEAGRKSRS